MPAAGRTGISAHRRSLVTATAAGTVLCALWFVPSVKATPELRDSGGGPRPAATAPGDSSSTASSRARTQAGDAAGETGRDGLTAPFVLSALGLAGTGGVLIVRARRRQGGSVAG